MVGQASAQSMSVESAKKTYQSTFESASTKRKQIVERADTEYAKTVETAKDQLRRTYESAIKAAAMRNDLETVAAFSKELQELNANGMPVPDKSKLDRRQVLDLLAGKWESESKANDPFVIFEITKNGKATKTEVYGWDGGETKRSEAYNVEVRSEGVVLLTPVDKTFPNSNSTYQFNLPVYQGRLEFVEISKWNNGVSEKKAYLVYTSS